MKKKIMLIALIVCLVIGGIGGVIYANGDHAPIIGDKLVGYGGFGHFPIGNYDNYSETAISFTLVNPDCVATIGIEQISLINTNTGVVIYEGPLIVFNAQDQVFEELHELGPHKSCLAFAQWMFPSEITIASPLMSLTVEVFYSGPPKSCPLMGSLISGTAFYENNTWVRGEPLRYIPMEAMTQKIDY